MAGNEGEAGLKYRVVRYQRGRENEYPWHGNSLAECMQRFGSEIQLSVHEDMTWVEERTDEGWKVVPTGKQASSGKNEVTLAT